MVKDFKKNNSKLDLFIKLTVSALLPTLFAGIVLGYVQDPATFLGDVENLQNWGIPKNPLVVITHLDNQSEEKSKDYVYVHGYATDENSIFKVEVRYTVEKGEEISKTRYYRVPLDQDGTWKFPIPKNENELKQKTSNPVTIIAKATDSRGNTGYTEITKMIETIPEEPIEVKESIDSFILPIITKDHDKQNEELKNITNTYTNNTLIVNGIIQTDDVKILKIRSSADNSTDSLTKYTSISEQKASETTLSWKHTLEKLAVRDDFQITIHAEYDEQKYWFTYYLDLTNIQ